MEKTNENTELNSEVTAEMSKNTEFSLRSVCGELPLPEIPRDTLYEFDSNGPLIHANEGQVHLLDLNVSHPILNDTVTDLNSEVSILNDLDTVLKKPNDDLNEGESDLNALGEDLNSFDADLNEDVRVLNESEAALSPITYLRVTPEDKPILKPELVNIFQYVKAQPIRADKVSLKPVGIDEALFIELKLITEQGGIPISRYCSEVLRHHEDVLGLQLMKNELAEYKQLYSEKVNELLHLTMDKKKVEESAQLLISASQAHLNAKNDTLSELQKKQIELDNANQKIATLSLGINNVSDAVQQAYEDYLTNILPETLKIALKDTYDEILAIVKKHRLPKDFESFENFFNESYQRNMELITKQQELKKLAQSKKNGI